MDQRVLQERHGDAVAKLRRRELDKNQRGEEGDAELQHELHPPRHAVVRAAAKLHPVIDRPDGAEGQRHEKHRPQIGIRQRHPEQGRQREGAEDQQTAHGRRSGLGQKVRFRPVGADRLAFRLMRLQPADQGRPEHQAEDQRRDRRPAGAEGDVAEQVEELIFAGKRHQKLRQHARPLRRLQAGWRDRPEARRQPARRRTRSTP